MVEQSAAKEATVLGLTEALCDDLSRLRQLLDSSFDRSPKAEGKVEGRPSHPNVLDEIMENMNCCRGQVTDIVEIVRAGVCAKIS